MDLKISQMLEMQKALNKAHQDSWSPLVPENGRNQLLWMIEEVGEVIAVIKKKTEKSIMDDAVVRDAFVEELSDVLMYFNDVLCCYNISSDELSKAYLKKHERNIHRQFDKEYEKYLSK